MGHFMGHIIGGYTPHFGGSFGGTRRHFGATLAPKRAAKEGVFTPLYAPYMPHICPLEEPFRLCPPVPPLPAAHRCATASAPRASASPANAPPRARQGRSICAPAARRFCALRAPVLGSTSPDCAPYGRPIRPPTAGEGTKSPCRSCRGFSLWAGRSIRRSQKRAPDPAKMPSNRLLIFGYSPAIATNNYRYISTGSLFCHQLSPILQIS